MSRLPELDLAEIAPLPTNLKWRELERHGSWRPRRTYKPFRAAISAILNLETEIFGRLPQPSVEDIKYAIKKESRNAPDEEINLPVAEGLFRHIVENKITGRAIDVYPMMIARGEKVTFWTPAVLNVSGCPLVPFFNPRRKQLSELGRRFVFSMMNERIRVENPDFSSVKLGIYHFGDENERGLRIPQLDDDDEYELYDLNQLEEMISETYSIWTKILEGRTSEARSQSGGSGPLL